MRRAVSIVGASLLLALAGEAAAQPAVTSLSVDHAPRSGRVVIRGDGFGGVPQDPNSYVEIGGVRAPNARWRNDRITAYVPSSLGAEPTSVRVVTPAGDSNELPITIDPTPAPDGRTLWKFEPDALYINHAGAIGPDGTFYVQDVYGFLYALTPDGQVRWIFSAGPYDQGGGGEGPVVMDRNGAIYCVGDPLGPNDTLYALDQSGQVLWTFTDPNTISVIAGPSIGPDGNIYIVFNTRGLDFGTGMGLVKLGPDGSFFWNVQGDPLMDEVGSVGVDIAFGPSTPGGHVDRVYVSFDEQYESDFDHFYAFDLNTGEQKWTIVPPPSGEPQSRPVVSSDGTIAQSGLISSAGYLLRAFNPDGSQRWTFHPQGVISSPTPAEVGADGTFYVGFNLNRLYAVNPDGSQKWYHLDDYLIQLHVPSPDNSMVLTGGVRTFGQPGFFRALDGATGGTLWTMLLGTDGPANVIAGFGRPVFTSDSSRAYVTGYLNMTPNDGEYCFVWTLATAACPCAGDFSCDGTVNSTDVSDFISAWFADQAGGTLITDFDANGVVNSTDVSEFINIWFGDVASGCSF